MPDQFYPEPDAPESESPVENDMEKGEETGEETSLLPASFFGGDVEVGHKCEVEVVGVHDGEIEVKYSKKPESKERQSEMNDAMEAGFASKPEAE